MNKDLIIYEDPKSPISEIFRTLRTNIQFMNTNKNSKTVLVTSAFPGEGKSWISSNLATTFAQTGKKIILIDADMRKGKQYSILGISPTPGLSNYLSGVNEETTSTRGKGVKSYIQKTEIKNLDVMVSGNVPPNPSELLGSAKMVELLEKVKKLYDIVIIDGTPCQLVTDSLILARVVDSTVIVVAHKSTKKKDLQRVITGINNIGGKISGVVLNKIPVQAKKYAQSYYYGSSSKKEFETEQTIFKEDDIQIIKSNTGIKKKGRSLKINTLIEEDLEEEFTEPENVETVVSNIDLKKAKTQKNKKNNKLIEEKKNIVIPLFEEIMVTTTHEENNTKDVKKKSKRKIIA